MALSESINYDLMLYIGDPEDGCEFYPNLHLDYAFGPNKPELSLNVTNSYVLLSGDEIESFNPEMPLGPYPEVEPVLGIIWLFTKEPLNQERTCKAVRQIINSSHLSDQYPFRICYTDAKIPEEFKSNMEYHRAMHEMIKASCEKREDMSAIFVEIKRTQENYTGPSRREDTAKDSAVGLVGPTLEELVNVLAERCPWTKEVEPTEMLSFLESECKEVREEILKIDTVRTVSDDAKSRKDDVAGNDDAFDDFSALEKEYGDVFFDVLMLGKVLERKYGRNFSLHRAKERAVRKMQHRCSYIWGPDVASSRADVEKIFHRRKAEENETKKQEKETEKQEKQEKDILVVKKECNFCTN